MGKMWHSSGTFRKNLKGQHIRRTTSIGARGMPRVPRVTSTRLLQKLRRSENRCSWKATTGLLYTPIDENTRIGARANAAGQRASSQTKSSWVYFDFYFF